MKKTLLISAIVLMTPLAVAAQSMRPGEWEFTNTMSSPMLPKPQSGTAKRCLSKEDAEDPTRFASSDKTQGCTITPGAKAAGSYKWSISCPDQGVSGNGSVRYSSNQMEADIRMLVSMQGQKTEMNSRVSGRYLGPCPQK